MNTASARITEAHPFFFVDSDRLKIASLLYGNLCTAGEEAGINIEVPSEGQAFRIVSLTLEYAVKVMLLEAVSSDAQEEVNHCVVYAAARFNISSDEGTWQMAPLRLDYTEPASPTEAEEDASRAARYQLVVKAARWALSADATGD